MRKLFVFLFLAVSGSIFSQNTLKGTVTDGFEPLPYAYVLLKNTDFHTVTDFDGKFIIYDIPDGNYSVTVSYVGYKKKDMLVHLEKSKIFELEIVLDEGYKLNEVVVNGRIEGQAKALNTQKNRKNIVNIVSSEQIERFPDANIGDALKRIPGINVQYDQGEARFANIRGTSPELSSVTVNGERVPSAEAEIRSVQLDLISADMIESIELNKAVTPDMDADAIGGSINLVSKKAAGKGGRIKGTIGTGYGFLSNKPLLKGNLSYSNRFFNNKLGIVLSASGLDKYVRSDNIEADWNFYDENNKNETSYLSDFQNRQYYLERLRQSYAVMFDLNINDNNSLYLSANYNWRNDWENRYRLRYKDIEMVGNNFESEIRRQTKGGSANNKNSRLEDQRVISIGIGGEHQINKLKIDWALNVNKASEERPNERYISFRKKGVEVTMDLNDKNNPHLSPVDPTLSDLSSEFSLKELTEEFQFTEEKNINSRLNFELPILRGENNSSLKFGFKYKIKQKDRDNSFKEYTPIDENEFETEALSHTVDVTNSDFNAGDYEVGSFISSEFLGSLNLNDENKFTAEDVLEEMAGNFNAEENINAGYLMYVQNFSAKLNIIAGVRYEGTWLEYQGKIYDGNNLDDSEKIKDSYFNLMPGFHVTYHSTKNTNLRFAFTNTLARPNYYDLVPYQEIDRDDNLIKIGNPGLKATTSINFDILAEHFFSNVGIVSGGIFYKDITNVISDMVMYNYDYNGHVYNRFAQPINTGNAYILGVEIDLQRRLDFLPGFLKNISFIGNYTYTYSKLKNITLEGRESEVLPLSGTPKDIMNASLAYDTKKLDVRISYNRAGKFIEEYGGDEFFDRWYDMVQYLDINANFKINKYFKIYASVNNILNQPLRYYQGISNRVAQKEYYGVYAKFGIKFKFK